MTPQERDDLDALAGEYVLGLLSGDAMARVNRLMMDDAALRAAVAFWQDRLQPLAVLAGQVDPPPALWQSIVDDLPPPPRRSAAERSTWWDSLAFWRLTAAAATVATLLLAFLTLVQPRSDVEYVAVLQAPDQTVGWIVHAASGQAVRLAPLVRTPVAGDRSLQFWTLYDRAQGPVSLGLVSGQERTLEFPRDRLPGLKEGQLFEITLEPYGGSTVGRPTGPVLFKGVTVPIG